MIKQRKRFIDSAILNAGYFLKLNKDERLFWLMLQLKCDAIGQFEMEGESLFAERMHGLRIDAKELQKKVNQNEERLRNLGSGHWFLTQFIREQYGRLNPNSPPHRRYIKDLKDSKLWNLFISENPDLKPADRVSIDYPYPTVTPEEEEEEKEEDQEKEEEEEAPPDFEKKSNGKDLNKRHSLKGKESDLSVNPISETPPSDSVTISDNSREPGNSETSLEFEMRNKGLLKGTPFLQNRKPKKKNQ